MKISIYIAVSANGLISNSRNVPDWLSQQYGEGFGAIIQRTKAVIMGKTTYNILAPDHLPLQKEGTTVVLTTDKQSTSSNSTVVFTQSKPREIAEMLSKKGHREAVIIGGTQVISEFINAGIVDDIFFVVEPVIFGMGLPLLKDVGLELKLKLVDFKKLNGDTILMHYALQKKSHNE